MFYKLPDLIQKEIIQLLQNNQFNLAKKRYDQEIDHQKSENNILIPNATESCHAKFS